MLSRRRFLQSTATATGVVAMPNFARADDSNCKPLAPAIAKLESLKDQAKPISVQERTERQEKARQLMRSNGLDAILVGPGTSLRYFTGIQWWGGERLFAMILTAKGKAFFVSPAFEQGRAEQLIANSPQAGSPDVRIWQEDASPYELVAQGLRDSGIATGTLGMEETTKFVFSDGIAKAAPQIKIASATPVTAGCRTIKSEYEIALMRLACKATIGVYEATFKSLTPGMTDADIRELVRAGYDRVGFEGDVIVAIGENSGSPHGSTVPQVMRENSVILLDDGCDVEGYSSDITRTFLLGKPTDRMKTVFDIVHRAQSAALAAAKPGVPCENIDAAARKVITGAGFGPDYKYFTHRVGHGIGMDVHEWPYLVRGNQTTLEPNMMFSDEPGIYIPGEFGIRLEDDMHITESGAELLTAQSPSLTDPFGAA